MTRSLRRRDLVFFSLLMCATHASCSLPRETVVKEVEQKHQVLGRYFADMVDRTDRLFGESRVEDRERKAEVSVGTDITLISDGSQDLGLGLSLRVPLPALERRANIFLDLEGTLESMNDLGEIDLKDGERSYAASANILTRLDLPLSFGTSLGLHWNDGPQGFLRPFLRYESRHDPWRYFAEQQVYYKTDDGFGEKTKGYIDRLLTPRSYLRFFSSAETYQEIDGFKIEHTALLRQDFIAESVLSFETTVLYRTADNIDEKTFFQVRWRGPIWRKWLEYEIRPRITFPWDDEEDLFFSLLFGIEITFADYLRPPGDADIPPY